jgi:hypothetical protein
MFYDKDKIKTIISIARVGKSMSSKDNAIFVGLGKNTIALRGVHIYFAQSFSGSTKDLTQSNDLTYFDCDQLIQKLKLFTSGVNIKGTEGEIAFFDDKLKASLMARSLSTEVVTVSSELPFYEIDHKTLSKQIDRVSKSAVKKNSDHPRVLTAINFSIDESGTTIAATDGHTLQTHSFSGWLNKTYNNLFGSRELNYPADVLSKALKLFNGANSLNVGIQEMSLVIESVDAVVKIEPIEGSFPNCAVLTPSSYRGSILFDNKTLAADVGKFKGSHSILVSIADGEVVLRNSDDSIVLTSPIVGESSDNTLLSFYVDPKLLELGLLSLDTPLFYLEDNLRPLFFKDDLSLFLLMPKKGFH